MSFKKCMGSIVMAMTVGILGSVAQPSLVLASSPTQITNQKYSATDIQKALRQNIQRHHIRNSTVSQVKVLHYIQHQQKIILVASCLIDGKKNIITGVLTQNKSTGRMFFNGGWGDSLKTPLFWGTNTSSDEYMSYVSGMALNKAITQVRLTPLPKNGQSVVVPVTPKGYFAAVVPTQPSASRPRISIEGLSSDGKVIYSFPNR